MKAIQLKILIYLNVRLIDCLLLFVWPRIIYPDSGNAIITVDRLALNVKLYLGDAATVATAKYRCPARRYAWILWKRQKWRNYKLQLKIESHKFQ